MTSDETRNRARRGDRTYDLPAQFSQVFHSDTVSGDDRIRWQLEVDCTVSAGRVAFQRVELVVHGEAMTPGEVQRLPWGQLATWAAESHAASTPAERLAARESLQSATRAAARRESRRRRRHGDRVTDVADGRAQRSATDADKLHQVLELRAEAEAAGEPYASYVAERMGYSTAYVRRLAKQARDTLGG